MKKRMWIMLAVAVMTMICLPMLAQAETVVELSNEHYYCSPGMERVGVYKDYASQIGSGLTRDDFDITYASGSEYVTVLDETGRVMISADAPLYNNLKLRITYTPKVSGVGTKTTFVVVLRTNKPIEQFSTEVKRICVANNRGTQVSVVLDGITDYSRQIASISYDPAVMTLDTYEFYGKIVNYEVKPAGAGETELIFTAYNGWEIRIPVIVVAKATQVVFGAEDFSCMVGDTVDLGLDLGNGPYGVEACEPGATLTRDGVSVSNAEFFPVNAGSFYAKEAGHYQVKITAAYGISNTVMIHVYDDSAVASIGLSADQLYKDRAGILVICYDAQGNEIVRPVSITAGADIASLEGRVITATGMGDVTVTAENPDGTTVSRTFPVVVNPTEMYVNAETLPLEIEETFDLEVSFDQGSYLYEYSVAYADSEPAFNLDCIRMEGDRIIAQAPGTATITVKAGPFTKKVTVTVADGDKALHIVLPPEPFGVGHTFKMSVQDKTGKVYPAVFDFLADYDHYAYDLQQDGTVTGKNASAETLRATLEDGRVLTYYLHVYKVPKWISHPDMIVPLAQASFQLDTVDSDVGPIDIYYDVEYTIADTSIATKWNDSTIDLHKAGTTTVTMWSELNPNATCTFILEVIDQQTLPIMYDSLDLPYGFGYEIPAAAADESGKEVPIEWAITYDEPGEGNPNTSGFILEEGYIVCTWPTASCVLTGTAEGLYEIRLYISGYLLPEAITLEPADITLHVGETADVEIVFDTQGASVKEAYWAPLKEDVITCNEVTSSVKNTITAVGEGSTVLMVALPGDIYGAMTVTVLPPRIPGDADDNRTVNIYDALTILKHLSGETVGINLSNAEVTGDGQLSVQDAMLIMKKGAGWNVTLK